MNIPLESVTVRTIAAETGLSIATVSRVLNGHLHVAPRTRAAVQSALAGHGAAGPTARRGAGAPGRERCRSSSAARTC